MIIHELTNDNGYEIRAIQIWTNPIYGVDQFIVCRGNVLISYHDTQAEAETELYNLENTNGTTD